MSGTRLRLLMRAGARSLCSCVFHGDTRIKPRARRGVTGLGPAVREIAGFGALMYSLGYRYIYAGRLTHLPISSEVRGQLSLPPPTRALPRPCPRPALYTQTRAVSLSFSVPLCPSRRPPLNSLRPASAFLQALPS